MIHFDIEAIRAEVRALDFVRGTPAEIAEWRIAYEDSRWPVLFLLDEFAALGRLEPVERAMGLMAGYGVQLWPILQDVHQLRAL